MFHKLDTTPSNIHNSSYPLAIDGFMPDLTYKQKVKVLIASSAMRVVNAAVVYCPDEMRVSNLKQVMSCDREYEFS